MYFLKLSPDTDQGLPVHMSAPAGLGHGSGESDWVGSGQVQIGSYQFNFLKKSDQVKFKSEWIKQISRIKPDYVTSTPNKSAPLP
jgi:hypothetical protein